MPPEYPKANYPTVVSGFINGPIRCESLDLEELYLNPGFLFPGLTWKVSGDSFSCRLKDFAPFQHEGRLWGVSNIQKKSYLGWINTDPQCFYSWCMPRLQKRDAKGTWIPGSELGIYIRKPFSWRWDVAGTWENGVFHHWIWTKGYFGFHYD